MSRNLILSTVFSLLIAVSATAGQIEEAARFEAQYETLCVLRTLTAPQMILEKIELAALQQGKLTAAQKLLLEEQIKTIDEVLPIRLRGVTLTAKQRADIEIRHRWATMAFKLGHTPAELPPGETTDWTVYGLYVFATQGEEVNPVLYRALADALASIGIDLETPVEAGSSWLGFGGKPLY